MGKSDPNTILLGCKLVWPLWKHLAVPQKVNRITKWPRNFTSRNIQEKEKYMSTEKKNYMNIYSSIICTSPKVWLTQISKYEWINIVYSYNEMLFCNKKEVRYQTDENKRSHIIRFHLYELSRIGKSRELSPYLGPLFHRGICRFWQWQLRG